MLHALSLYSSRDGDVITFAELSDQPEGLNVEDIRDPEKLSSLVAKILRERTSQKASISSRFAPVMGRLYPLVSLALGIGSTIAEGIAFVPVKGAVNALSLLLIADQEHTKATDFLKQLDRIALQALRVAEVNKVGVEINNLLLEKSTDLMTAILVFFKGALLYFNRDFFQRYWKAILLGPNVYTDAKAELDNAIKEFDQMLLLQVTLIVISGQKEAYQSETESAAGPTTVELVSWLQSSLWDIESDFLRHCRRRTRGTLEWIFTMTEFTEWRLGSSGPRSLA